MTAPSYTSPTPIRDIVSDADQVTALLAIAALNDDLTFDVQMFVADPPVAGNPGGTNNVTDVSSYLIKDRQNDVLSWDSTANVCGSVTFSTTYSGFTWGRDQVRIYQLVQAPNYSASLGLDRATWHRFLLGTYVVTTPGYADLDRAFAHDVVAYDRNYFLQTGPQKSYTFGVASNVQSALNTVFSDALNGANLLTSYCDVDGSISTKTFAQTATYDITSGMTYLDIVNDIAAQGGCRPIYQQPNARWKIDKIIPNSGDSSVPTRWGWDGSDGSGSSSSLLADKVVVQHDTQYNASVYGLPNKFVFVQSGLTYAPTEGNGQVTFNNYSTQPNGQTIIGRVLQVTQSLPAVSQADLVAQGTKIFNEALASGEQVALTTRAWPAARHYDLFLFQHQNFPATTLRRLQARQWTLPLWGNPMTWQTYAVGNS